MNSGRKDELYSFIVKESGRLNKMLTVGDIASINARLSGAGTIKEAVF
jgi:hypothetical protein